MEALQTWSEAITISLQDLWGRFVAFLPSLLGAIIIFIIGWIVAVTVGKIIERILDVFHVDSAVDKIGLKKDLAKAGVKVHVARFIGEVTKWFLIVVFLMAATDIIGLTQVTNFLNDVLGYIPQIIVAAIILVVAVLLANFVQRLVKDSVKATGLFSADAIAAFAKWAILIFAISAALIQLKVADETISIVIKGLVAMLAGAGALAFGLGGRDAAEELIEKAKKEFSNGSNSK